MRWMRSAGQREAPMAREQAVSADCPVSQEETLVLPVKPQAIPLPLRSHFATPKVAPVSVSRRPQSVTASLLPETALLSLSLVLVARYERYRNKPTLRQSRAR